MRSALFGFLAAIAGCASPAHADTSEPGRQIISIDTDALATVNALNSERILEATGDFAIVEVDAAELAVLSERMHDYHRCGGFMVHESVEEARTVARDRKPIEYTLDRAAVVEVVLSQLDKSRILDTIEQLSAMPTRHFKSKPGAQASIWLRDKWQSLTTRDDVTVELFDHGWPQKSVILTIPGTTRAHEVVVLGGHLDSITFAGGAAPGADDDASGIATLTEIARVLLASNFRPERTIKIMAYAAEEVGLRGSQGIVKDFQQRKVDVVGALQLDMTNYRGSERDIWLMKDFTSAAQNTFLIQLIESYTGATYGLDACGYACSDHASWYRAGVPASMPFESRMNDRNMAIHSRNDTLEKSGNNADHAIKFARLGASYAIELAKGELGSTSTVIAAAEEPAGTPWGVLLALAWFSIAVGAYLRFTPLR